MSVGLMDLVDDTGTERHKLMTFVKEGNMSVFSTTSCCRNLVV